jgi:hypothetical protein
VEVGGKKVVNGLISLAGIGLEMDCLHHNVFCAEGDVLTARTCRK